jgi:hypothetical protein
MKEHFARFTLGGMKWNIYVDNHKTMAANSLYKLDKEQLEINIASEIKGFAAPKDKMKEHSLRGIVSQTLQLMGEEKYQKDDFIAPFVSFLHQFLRTDTFGGKEGTFNLGGVTWNVVSDHSYTYHRNVNGECDSNIGRVILDLIDVETGGDKKIDLVRMIYIHEVLHAIMHQMGLEHEENFVKTFGLFLNEILTSLMFIAGEGEIPAWPLKSKE